MAEMKEGRDGGWGRSGERMTEVTVGLPGSNWNHVANLKSQHLSPTPRASDVILGVAWAAERL